MQELATTNGRALDFLSTRVLSSDFASTDTSVIIRDIQSGVADTTRYSGDLGDLNTGPDAALTPNGAAFIAHVTGAVYSQVYIARAGQPVATRDVNGSTTLAVRGTYAIYTTGLNPSPLWRFNTMTGVEDQIAASASNVNQAVAENGDVAYWGKARNYNIYQWDDDADHE